MGGKSSKSKDSDLKSSSSALSDRARKSSAMDSVYLTDDKEYFSML